MVAAFCETPVISSNFLYVFAPNLLKLFSIGLLHVAGTKPQFGGTVVTGIVVSTGVVVVVDGIVVVVVDGIVVVVDGIVVVVVDDAVVVVVDVSGGDPQPTRFNATLMSSKFPPIVVAAPPKLSTPKPIQSRFCGKSLPAGTLEPIPFGESHVTE